MLFVKKLQNNQTITLQLFITYATQIILKYLREKSGDFYHVYDFKELLKITQSHKTLQSMNKILFTFRRVEKLLTYYFPTQIKNLNQLFKIL